MDERVVLEAEGILTAALEQAVDAVVAFDEAETVILFNAAAEGLWGCDRLDVLGRGVRDCLPQLLPAAVPVGGQGPRARARGGIHEIAISRHDGVESIASISLSQLAVGDGTIHMAVARDISDEARDRRELRLLSLAADETDRVVVITDASRSIVYVNDAFTRMFGYRLGEVVGRSSQEIFADRNAPVDTLLALRRRVDRAEGFQEEQCVRDKNGRTIWVNVAITPILDEQGAVANVVAVLSNIDEGKRLQLLQRDVLEAVASDRPLREVMLLICHRVEEMTPGVVCSVLSVDEKKRLRALAAPSLPQHVNDAIDGLQSGPVTGSCGTAVYRGEPVIVTDVETDPLWVDFRDLVRPLGVKACWSSPIKLRDGKVAGTFAFYYKENRGPSVWHEQVVAACLHLCVLAIERDAAKAAIAQLAYYDTLTGLPNRARLREVIRERLAAVNTGENLAFLFLDIDRFKDVNDTLGHSVGDRLLNEIARRLQTQLGPLDVVSRYGGDEFVILVGDCGAERAGKLAGAMIEQLLAPVIVENMTLPVSASIGISVFPGDGGDEDSLLKHADTAMYQAKGAGGGTFRFFSPEMHGLAQERLVLGSALREAIARRQLKLHYQPQIDCGTGAVRGVEALARWTHPIFGEVSPGRFIALAEECGLIEAIGQWALNEAAAQMARWRRARIDIPSVSVNLSAVHFRNPDLTEQVAQTLARHGLEPEMLTVEITEGVIMDDNPTAIETAKAIHGLGVRLSLDDFGTGYSSLSYLARLPIDELKIDRGFMRDLENDKNAQAVVTAVVRIGQSLGLTVVAEGVEGRSQQRFLEALNCDVLQGFLISKALAPAEFESWYASYAVGDRVVRFPGAA